MAKEIVAYCWNCGRDTRHIKLQCEDTPLERIFFGLATAGMSELMGHDYKCECTRCGFIHTVSR